MMMRYFLAFCVLALLPCSVSAERARLTRSGIIIVGSGEHVRAFEPFKGAMDNGLGYAEAVNKYKQTFGSAVNVYCMIIPTAVALYCPDEAKEWTNDQCTVVRSIYAHLSDSVKVIDLFDTMQKHVGEDIYSRTDHHWAPLGAYYAAQQFAGQAGLPFADLSTYDKHVIHDYVGTMYRFSRDAAVKNAPEDFVYYTPTGVDYSTTYIRYTLGKHRQVVGEKAPEEGNFFYQYEDGNSQAYMTLLWQCHSCLSLPFVRGDSCGGLPLFPQEHCSLRSQERYHRYPLCQQCRSCLCTCHAEVLQPLSGAII